MSPLLQARDFTVFARVDHSGEAEKVGLKMSPTQLIIFGSPKAVQSPDGSLADLSQLILPLKALAWEDADGKIWLSYNRPDYLRQRHNVPDELVTNIAGVGAVLEKAVEWSLAVSILLVARGCMADPRPNDHRPAVGDRSNRGSDHLANERTFLAWLRTGIAIGFAIGRFAIVIREFMQIQGSRVTDGRAFRLVR